jgi:hypothetical protein
MKLTNLMEERGKDFEKYENPLGIYVVPCPMCDDKIKKLCSRIWP